MIPQMFRERIKRIYLYRYALRDMVISQLKVKYSGSILGIWLAIINPLLLMLAITFVFTIIFKIEMKHFSLFVLSGIFPWMFFSGALSEATFSIFNQQSILRQFNLPRESLVLSSVLSNFLNFLFGWCVMYPLFLFFNPKIVTLLPFLLVIFLLNLFFIYGLSLILSILNVFFRDIGQLLGVFLMFWFWITPVFYSADMIPAGFRWICDFNPMTSYIVGYREVVFYGNVPGALILTGAFFWAIVSMVLGLVLFAQLEPKILKRI